MKDVKYACVELELDGDPGYQDATEVRGFFGKLWDDSMSHGHVGDGFAYRHPMVQYKLAGRRLLITAFGDGARWLGARSLPEKLELDHRRFEVVAMMSNAQDLRIGVGGEHQRYRFLSPWLALNGDNSGKYAAMGVDTGMASDLLRRILIGNLLSLAKAAEHHVQERIEVRPCLREQGRSVIREKGCFLGFAGEFTSNFQLPPLWGIGRFSSRGYGTTEMIA